jgi:HEAT repeat protein
MRLAILSSLSFVFLVTGSGLAQEGVTHVADKTKDEWLKILREDESARKRSSAVVALSRFTKRTNDIVDALREALSNDKADSVRLQAAKIVADFDVKTEDGRDHFAKMIPTLADLLRGDKSVMVRAAAAKALGQAGEKATTVINTIINGLKDTDANVRIASAHTIGQLGEVAKAAVPELIPLLKDMDDHVRLEAVYALGRVGGAGVLAVGDLSKVLAADTDATVRKEAARAFKLIGGEAREAVPALAKALREDKSEEVRQECALALGKMAGDVKDVAGQLLEAVQKDADKDVRIFSVHALSSGLVNSDLKMHVKVLAEHLGKEQEGDVRIAIISVLGTLGPDGVEALPALNKASADVQVNVRNAAKAAIKKIKGA